MTIEALNNTEATVDWLFSIGEGRGLPAIDGLLAVDDYDPKGRSPEEVAIMEKAHSYGARAVFFEAERHGRSPIAQAFIFESTDELDDARFAELHKRLWSWGGVPLVYRAAPGCIQLFRCAHEPDFVGSGDVAVCRPIRTLLIGAKIAAEEIWWDAARIRNGTIWDDPDTCKLMLSAQKAAHRTLVEEVRAVLEDETIVKVAHNAKFDLKTPAASRAADAGRICSRLAAFCALSAASPLRWPRKPSPYTSPSSGSSWLRSRPRLDHSGVESLK